MATDPRIGRGRPAAPARPRRGIQPTPGTEYTPEGYQPTEGYYPPEPPQNDWRDNIVGLSGLNVIAGIWLIIAPWVLGYTAGDPKWNDVVFGIIVGCFALIRAAGAYRESWLSIANAVIGVWLFIAAFTIDASGTAAANDIILGVIVFLLAVGSATSTPSFRRRPTGAAPTV